MQIYKQKGNFDCLLACIAMLVQKPIEDIWYEHFRQVVEANRGSHGTAIDDAFSVAGLRKNTDYWCVPIPQVISYDTIRALLNGRRAILQVRSLNLAKTGHFVYWAGETLYDVSDKYQYQWLEQCFPEYIWIFNEITAA